MIRENASRRDVRFWAAFAVMVLIAGLNFPAVRFSNRELAPFYGAGIRFLAAALLFYAFVVWRGIALPTREQMKGTVLYGVLNFAASYAFAYVALVSLPSGVAAVILGSVPVITLLLAAGQGVERFRLRGLIGAIIAVAGIVVLVGAPSKVHVSVGAVLFMLGAALSGSESSIVIKKYPTGDPMATNAVGMAVGGILLLVLSAVFGERWSVPANWTTWASLVYLVLFGSIGLFGLFLYALKRGTATRVSYMFVLTPIIASPSGAALAGESVTLAMIVGGIIVLLGVYLGALSGPTASAPQPAPAHPAPAEP